MPRGAGRGFSVEGRKSWFPVRHLRRAANQKRANKPGVRVVGALIWIVLLWGDFGGRITLRITLSVVRYRPLGTGRSWVWIYARMAGSGNGFVGFGAHGVANFTEFTSSVVQPLAAPGSPGCPQKSLGVAVGVVNVWLIRAEWRAGLAQMRRRKELQRTGTRMCNTKRTLRNETTGAARCALPRNTRARGRR